MRLFERWAGVVLGVLVAGLPPGHLAAQGDAAAVAADEAQPSTGADPGEDTAPGCGPIVTDRPGATNGHGVLAPGCFQAEMSVALLRGKSPTVWLLTAPTVLRVGVLPRFELRFETGIGEFVHAPNVGGDVSVTDVESPVFTFATKVTLVPQDGLVPGLGLYAAVDLDEPGYLSDADGGWRATPRGLLLFDWAFADPVGLSVNVGIAGPPEGDGSGRDVVVPFAVVLGFAAPHGVSPFVDLASSVRGARYTQSLGGGLAWRFAPKLQVDAGFSIVTVDGSVRGDTVGGWALSLGLSTGN